VREYSYHYAKSVVKYDHQKAVCFSRLLGVH
jgi:hypothetical protein